MNTIVTESSYLLEITGKVDEILRWARVPEKLKFRVRLMSPTPRHMHSFEYFTRKELLLTQHS